MDAHTAQRVATVAVRDLTRRFGTRIAHGPLVYTMSIGLMPIDFFGDAIVAFLGADDLRHTAPVFAGDTIDVRAEVTEARATSAGDAGVVTIRYVTRNQRGETVQHGKFTFLVAKRPAAAAAQGGSA